jgi:hypothetical protein
MNSTGFLYDQCQILANLNEFVNPNFTWIALPPVTAYGHMVELGCHNKEGFSAENQVS